MYKFHFVFTFLLCVLFNFMVVLHENGIDKLTSAIVVSIIPAMICIILLFFLKTPNLSRWEIFYTFMCGFSIAVSAAYIVPEIFSSDFTSWGASAKNTTSIGKTILFACQEEFYKLIFIMPLLLARKTKLADVVVLTWAVGLGFALQEDIMYLARYSTSIFWTRMSSSIVHVAYTLIASMSIYSAVQARGMLSKINRMGWGFLGAVIFHTLWNISCVPEKQLLHTFLVIAVEAPILAWSLCLVLPEKYDEKLLIKP